MKKIIILAMAAMPFLSNAQDKGTTGNTSVSKVAENKFAIENPEVIFIELVASTNSAGAQVIKADFGREIITGLADKELAKQLGELRTMSFPSMPDAMNYLASLGYKFQQNYTTHDKDGKADTHFVYEKRLPRKQNTESGITKPRPERPERPDGAKPATDVNPKERTPTVKPGEKK